MAIGDLLGALEREAAAEVAALGAAARADAARRTTEAAARRASHCEVALDRCRAAAQAATDAALADAARRGRREVLTARAAALDRLRAAVAATLPALLAGPDREPLLDQLTAALLAATGATAAVRCAPALVDGVAARLAAHPGLRVAPDATITTGMVAERDGGRVVIDATLTSLLHRLWPRLRLEARPAERAP